MDSKHALESTRLIGTPEHKGVFGRSYTPGFRHRGLDDLMDWRFRTDRIRRGRISCEHVRLAT
ncbi:hypothetical protein, partial [Thiomonas sp. SCN 64-16]|uniref:hypothetical protein n=1 Tax=Thiomonas sp. SCN 64-16 TaxID=1660151 RepID=UPI00338F84F5